MAGKRPPSRSVTSGRVVPVFASCSYRNEIDRKIEVLPIARRSKYYSAEECIIVYKTAPGNKKNQSDVLHKHPSRLLPTAQKGTVFIGRTPGGSHSVFVIRWIAGFPVRPSAATPRPSRYIAVSDTQQSFLAD